jgi:hypothetical protein
MLEPEQTEVISPSCSRSSSKERFNCILEVDELGYKLNIFALREGISQIAGKFLKIVS